MPIRQLQQNASEIIERVARGERVEITRNGKLVAELAVSAFVTYDKRLAEIAGSRGLPVFSPA